MKVLVELSRTVNYAKIVDLTPAEFRHLSKGLDSSDRAERKASEERINEMIHPNDDWQGDDLDYISTFEKHKP